MDLKLKAFLDLIGWSEGTDTDSAKGYGVIVSGVDGSNSFRDFSSHPFAGGRPPILVRPGLYSTASGRYQLMLHWWLPYKNLLGLPDFSPASQDSIALQQIKERGGISMIEAGNIQGAIEACSNIWASFPGNDYAQGGRSISALLSMYQTLLEGETDAQNSNVSSSG